MLGPMNIRSHVIFNRAGHMVLAQFDRCGQKDPSIKLLIKSLYKVDILIITVQDNVCHLQWQPMLLFQTICPRRTTLYKSYLTANTHSSSWVRILVVWRHWTYSWTVKFVDFKWYAILLDWTSKSLESKILNCSFHKIHEIKFQRI